MQPNHPKSDRLLDKGEVQGIAEGNLESVASEMAEAEKAEVMTTAAPDAAALPVEREADDGSPIEARALT